MIHILTTEVSRGPRSKTDKNKAKAEMLGFNRLLVVLYPKQETFMSKGRKCLLWKKLNMSKWLL